MNNKQQTARVGIFFLLGIALIWVAFETLSDGKVFKQNGYTLVAGFSNLKELKVGDEVRMAGVTIGSVKEVRLTGRRAEAVLEINPSQKIAGDATATIVMAGLIGTNYIGIDLGTTGAPPLEPGAEIRTKVTADLNTVMSDLGDLGKKLDTALSSIGDVMKGQDGKPGLFQRLDGLVAENSSKISKTLTDLQEITASLNAGKGSLGKLINDPKLHDELLATIEQIKSAAEDAKQSMSNANAIIDQVKSGKGTIGSLVYDDAAGNDLKRVAQLLREITEKINRGEGSLGKLINDDSLVRDAQSTIKKADRALDSLDDAGPINAVGVVAKSLF